MQLTFTIYELGDVLIYVPDPSAYSFHIIMIGE